MKFCSKARKSVRIRDREGAGEIARNLRHEKPASCPVAYAYGYGRRGCRSFVPSLE